FSGSESLVAPCACEGMRLPHDSRDGAEGAGPAWAQAARAQVSQNRERLTGAERKELARLDGYCCSRTHDRSKGRRPSKHSLGSGYAVCGLLAVTSQDDPHRRTAFIDTTVAHGLAMVGLLPLWNENQLQGDSIRLFEHRVRAD